MISAPAGVITLVYDVVPVEYNNCPGEAPHE